MRFGIAVDTASCMACYNCFMACKDEHCGFATAVSAPQPHEGQRWIDIRTRERGDDNRKVKTSNVAVMCAHCENPACAAAAKNGAVTVREDGIVLIDPVKAKGQRQIAEACPIGAVYWNEELQIPQKCTMCAHLLDAGCEKPRCVEACPNGALHFGDLDDPDSEVSRVIAANRQTPLKVLEGVSTGVKYLNIPTVFLAGSVYTPGDETGDEPVDGAEIALLCRETGETLRTRTNYFGDWEFEWLTPGGHYDLTVSAEGYRPAVLAARADTDHYLGEQMLEKA